MYVSRPYAPLETRIKSYTTYARNLPAALSNIKSSLRPPLAMNLVKIGRQTIGGLSDFMATDIVKVFLEMPDKIWEDLRREIDGQTGRAAYTTGAKG